LTPAVHADEKGETSGNGHEVKSEKSIRHARTNGLNVQRCFLGRSDGMRPPFGTGPQKLTGNVPKHILCDTVVALLPSLGT
jgi:hypothetical protein